MFGGPLWDRGNFFKKPGSYVKEPARRARVPLWRADGYGPEVDQAVVGERVGGVWVGGVEVGEGRGLFRRQARDARLRFRPT